MLFRHSTHAGIRDGSITLTFRRWSRPQARPGGRYRLDADGVVEATAVDIVRIADITTADARRAGFTDLPALLCDLNPGASPTPTDTGPLYRITFRYIPLEDPRLTLAAHDELSADDIAALQARLNRMDRTSKYGPWTRTTLHLIRDNPRVRAPDLAARLNRPTLEFKRDVRKLKALGLTLSHEVGYTLSRRGRALVRNNPRA